MTIHSLYEPASSDGYKSSGDGVFLLSKSAARQLAQNKHGCYASEPIRHDAIETEDGRYLILESKKPVSLLDPNQASEDIIKRALSKLTPAEISALGIKAE